MPAVKKQPPTVVKTTESVEPAPIPAAAPKAANGKERKVIHPEIVHEDAFGADAITCQRMKEILWWEDEDEYRARTLRETGTALEKVDFDFIDMRGKKVSCWRNPNNRRFNRDDVLTYMQEVLNRNWAGPTTFPGETINGEPIIISKYDNVLSGQKRAIGFIFACQVWAGAGETDQSEHWRKLWPTEPVFETVVTYGVSEDVRVIRSIDNVVTRSEADVIDTSGIYANIKDRGKRNEMSRMLAKAIDTLWRRTGAASDPYHKYQTHTESMRFLENHGRLKKCLQYLFEVNSSDNGRGISMMKFSPGQSAALMYLMGSSKSDGVAYRRSDPRKETKLDWTMWDKAAEFWSEFAKLGIKDVIRKDKDGKATTAKTAPSVRNCKLWEVRNALFALQNDRGEDTASWEEKSAIICHAWHAFATTGKVEAADLQVEYAERTVDGETIKILDDFPNLGGIDEGEKPRKASQDDEGGEMSQEELEARAAEARAQTEAETERRKAAEEARKKIEEMRKAKAPVPAKPPAPKFVKNAKTPKSK